ncbi:MAG: D-tyrosyl-tRNA(Tyr) deacylase (EC [uncultured Thiotrichaceae bacterium]|uniref:D-aminoacyl-tRNA deacylase n=1 Tax=uncultured Thiotrichaceae bacterium TaxID=298394 RepID=A0A6S6TIM8_9GAMM|nr:MAG: D-tyrosyl-tRNA(Tyr) deacylase (EC [uncultured Thiotrichaceae bacterium]
MIALIQRVTSASVTVDQQCISSIDEGILLLLGVEKADTPAITKRMAERVCRYRIFEDTSGKMNLSLLNIQGSLLVVSQFTLPADTTRGSRPSFTPAASPELGYALYQEFIKQSHVLIPNVQEGQFGADMKVQLTNDGPVTFWLQQN